VNGVEWDAGADVAAMILLVLGALLSLTAAIGLLRFPDVLARLHAATKPQVLGVLLIVVGVALRLRSVLDIGMLLLAGTMQMLTLPVAAQMVGRAVYRTQQLEPDCLVIDELSNPPSQPSSG
jgi:multicomponent Na+:H+ antiporter subunit G